MNDYYVFVAACVCVCLCEVGVVSLVFSVYTIIWLHRFPIAAGSDYSASVEVVVFK